MNRIFGTLRQLLKGLKLLALLGWHGSVERLAEKTFLSWKSAFATPAMTFLGSLKKADGPERRLSKI